MGHVRKFYIADTHFGHANIIGYCDRPFRTVGVMDEQLIRRWNSVVGPDDVIFHLGDFALCLGDPLRLRWIFTRLNGRKRLIVGNHDLNRKGDLHPALADLAWDTTPSLGLETSDGGKRVWLSHYAHRCWPGMHAGSFHFYGHSHGGAPPFGNSRDVGVDLEDVDFTPRTFEELAAPLMVPSSAVQD